MKHVRTEPSTEMLGTHFDLSEALFCIAFSCLFCLQLLQQYTFFAAGLDNRFVLVSRALALFLLLICEFLDYRKGIRWSWKSWAALGVCFAFGLCCWLAQAIAELWMMPLVFCSRNREIRQILTLSLILYSVVLVITVLAASMGLIEAYVFEGTRTRQCIGFRYPLYPATILFNITCITLLINAESLNWHTVVSLMIAVVLVYYLTVSRLSFVLSATLLLFALCCIAIRHPREMGQTKARPILVGSSMFVFAALVSITVSILYDPSIEWMARANGILGGRLQLGHDGIEEFGIALLGKTTHMRTATLSPLGELQSGRYNFIDSVYIQLPVKFGIVGMFVYLFLMSLVTYKAARSGNLLIIAVCAAIAIHGMIDNQTLYPWMNPLWLCSISFFSERPEYAKLYPLFARPLPIHKHGQD